MEYQEQELVSLSELALFAGLAPRIARWTFWTHDEFPDHEKCARADGVRWKWATKKGVRGSIGFSCAKPNVNRSFHYGAM